MALQVGELYAKFGVKTELGSFFKGAQSVVQGVQRIGGQLRAVGREASRLGAVLAAGMALAVREAAKSNGDVTDAVKRVHVATAALGASVGEMLLPVMRNLADTLGRVTNWFRSLSPEQKQQIAHWLQIAATVLGVVTIIGRVGSVISALARVVGLVLPLIGSVFTGIAAVLTAPITATMALVAAAAVAAVAVYEAWATNWHGIRDVFAEVWDWIKEQVGKLMDPLKKVLGFFKDEFIKLIDTLVGLFEKLANTWAGKKLGLDPQGVAEFRRDLNAWLQHIISPEGAAEVGNAALALGKSIGSKIVDGTKSVVKKLENLLPNLSSFSPNVSDPHDHFATIADRLQKRQELLNRVLKTVNEGGEFHGFGDPTKNLLTSVARPSMEVLDQIYDRVKTLGERFNEVFTAAIDQFLARAKDTLLNNAGELSNLIKAAQQGAEAGGAGGAIANVIAELLQKSQGFKETVQMVDEIIQRVADFLGKIFVAIQPLLGALDDLVGGVLTALAPAMTALFSLLDPLLAPIEMIGRIFAAFAPIIQLLVNVVKLLLEPLNILTNIAMRALFEALRVVAIIVLGIAEAIGAAWNAILGAIQGLLSAIGLGDWAKSLDALKADTDGMAKAMNGLMNVTFDQATAQAKTTAATLKMGDAAANAAESLSNVPSGYKVALARFLAIDTGGGSSGTPGAGSSGGGGSTGSGGPPTGGDTHVHVYLNTKEIAAQMKIEQKLDRFARTGSTADRAPMWAGT